MASFRPLGCKVVQGIVCDVAMFIDVRKYAQMID